ncbi:MULTISPECIES: alpha/beta hydrolase [Acinetobacter]|uniref:Alpha/beta fold hydrolase n=1 Tax=Acinetobacter indicus TaxID=756892 RepID=A0AAW8Z6G3_9GAMM|nr:MULTISPECIES: alpha/beta fold hydrolase [Acinetobacter]MCO8089236.1 lysophospholipase [Acinetobacter indicus]MCO8100519.1 lysophospholipase [Acinetobacter indicus]MCO8106078.1 lysophospholipase [Acinetobacter indicus]MCO8111731.1 lysophospholipase [Acinetobacter indicus]MDM1243719.1 alpha/beta fold hydrolase [Acinetobacter indicus]
MSNRKYPDTSHIEKSVYESNFLTEGDMCSATLHVPKESATQKLPAVLMVGGWGSIQGALTDSFINHFVTQGYAVMEFDYPGWGLSGGLPRQDINPWKRVKTVNKALSHLKSMPQVDADNIIAWGTSFGGGHVVDLVAEHPELKGAIIQVPMLDGISTVRSVPLPQMFKFLGYGLADRIKPGKRICIPTVSQPGQLGAMDRDQAWNAMELAKEKLNIDYDNRVTARSLLTMGFYRPWKRLKQVKVPMLIVGATQDTVAPFVAKKIEKVKNPFIQMKKIEADHFDPYFEPYFSQNLSYQLDFLNSLKSSRAHV